jgi:hypothetical protein
VVLVGVLVDVEVGVLVGSEMVMIAPVTGKLPVAVTGCPFPSTNPTSAPIETSVE